MIKTVSGNHLQMRYVNIGPLPVMGLCNQLYYLVASVMEQFSYGKVIKISMSQKCEKHDFDDPQIGL